MTGVQTCALPIFAGSNISQRLRGRITWPAEDLFKLAEAFGIEVADLYPSRAADGSWVPAAYVPGMRKTPARVGAGVSGIMAENLSVINFFPFYHFYVNYIKSTDQKQFL